MKTRFGISYILCLVTMVMSVSCLRDGEDTIVLENTPAPIEDIIPPVILDEMEEYILIHRGENPPKVEGVYLVEPEAVYCSDNGFEPGYDNIFRHLSRFFNQNDRTLTLDYEEKNEQGSHSEGIGSFISGSGNNFTVYFDTEGITNDEGVEIWRKTALVISGTLTSAGIQDLQYSFVMVEKKDPDGHLMDEGEFRVFKDKDGVSPKSSWNLFSTKSTRSGDTDNFPWFQYIRSLE